MVATLKATAAKMRCLQHQPKPGKVKVPTKTAPPKKGVAPRPKPAPSIPGVTPVKPRPVKPKAKVPAPKPAPGAKSPVKGTAKKAGGCPPCGC